MRKIFKYLIDYLCSFLLLPFLYILKFYRSSGVSQYPRITRTLKKVGLFPIIDHYYEPLFDLKYLTDSLEKDRNLPGINLDSQHQINFISSMKYQNEIISYGWDKKNKDQRMFYLGNGLFGPGDAEYLYQFIRMIKPKKIIEIGSGHSTKIVNCAVMKNFKSEGINSEHICIEPYEQLWLERLNGVKVKRERIELLDIDWRTELNSGDFLFIDSSHVIRPQGDVLKIYLEILPLLMKGVFVHVHDIFTPKDYSFGHIGVDIRFWNEQYILEAVLGNRSRYQIISALNFLKSHHYDELKKVCPYLSNEANPGSFYFQIS